MAEEKEGGGSDVMEAAGEPSKPAFKLTPAIILALANTITILAALGLMVYIKVLYKRPIIAEHDELLKKQTELKDAPKLSEAPLVQFDQLRVNIAMTSGKAHYVTLVYSIECSDQKAVAIVNQKKDIFIDKIIASLGRRQMTELNTIQGKLMLKTELIRSFNEITKPGTVTGIYFSAFVLQ